jgi:predicted DNA-binding transcriptional regulator YafY
MVDLAREFGVSYKTIKTDIDILTADYRYPVETIRGNGGGIRFAEGFSPYKGLLTSEQRQAILVAIGTADPKHAAHLKRILESF